MDGTSHDGPAAPRGARPDIERGVARTQRFLAAHRDLVRILPLSGEAPSVHDAARELGVEASQIVKALVLDGMRGALLLLVPGDARVDNKSFQTRFGVRPRLLSTIDTVRLTGHPIGSVGPFGLLTQMPTYIDSHSLGSTSCSPQQARRTRSSRFRRQT